MKGKEFCMKILEHNAQKIVEKASEILKFPISITDNEGIIIGSTDKSRIGIFHKPSLEVIKKNEIVDCKTEVEKKILPGVSTPIKFNNKVIGVLGIVGSPREVEKYVQLVKNQVEMLCQEAFRNEMLELKEKMIEMFVHQLINYNENETNETDHIHQYANLLEFDFQKDRVCLVIKINRFAQNLPSKKVNDEFFGTFQYFQKDVLGFLHLIFHECKDDIISLLDFERFIVIKSLPYKQSYSTLIASLDENLKKLNTFVEKKYPASVSISVGDKNKGIRGIIESYNNAIKAMNLGVSFEEGTGIYVYKELETLLWLLPKELNPTYQVKLLRSITSLIEHDNYEILSSTFIEFCKCNMNLSVASRNLYIHRNTIIYRLEKIKEITSLNTNSFEHCMLLFTAIQCYEESKRRKG